MTKRQILTPGEAPAAQPAAAPAPADGQTQAALADSQGAAGADDDLAEFESEELPRVPPQAFTPEQQAVVAQMIASAVAASKSSQDPQTAARLAAAVNSTERLPTQEAAMALQADAVARGVRPRAILTADGWVTHVEMARSKGAPALGTE
jgi:hypothetical protein